MKHIINEYPKRRFQRVLAVISSDNRIIEHPILDFRRGRKVKFYFEDTVVEAYEGESVIAALYAIGVRALSINPASNRPRAPFCMIGKCGGCLATVDGIPNTRLCLEPVREGMRIYRQRGYPEVPSIEEPVEAETEYMEVDTLIIGGGPAGLKAAQVLGRLGYKVLIIDEHFKLGGQLVKQTHKFFGDKKYFGGTRGFHIAEKLVEEISKYENVVAYTHAFAYGIFKEGVVGIAVRGSRPKNLVVKPKTIIAGTGAYEKTILFDNNDLPGIMGAGAVQTLMNEYGVYPGEKALVVGSGNVGLIVTYQLLQAGVKVRALVEIMPKIGGWFVHAAKIRRYGVPILTRHSVIMAIGEDRVEKAVIAKFDEKFQPIHGTERVYDVDLLLLAVGLAPNYAFFSQAGCVMRWIPELGGLAPIRTRYLETSVENLFIAGDASGIEEATTAFVEGEIAALSAAIKMGCEKKEVVKERERLLDYLWNEYRLSPVVSRAREGKLKATVSEEEIEKIRRGVLSGV